MTARPLDEVLPQRAAIRWIQLRAWSVPRVKAIAEGLKRGWLSAAPWIAALALVLVYLLVCTWLERRDAIAESEAASQAVTLLQRENRVLRTRIGERDAASSRNVFYVVEGESIDQAATKLQRLALAIAGDAFDMKDAPTEQSK